MRFIQVVLFIVLPRAGVPQKQTDGEILRRIRSQNQTFFSVVRGRQVDETSAKADGGHVFVCSRDRRSKKRRNLVADGTCSLLLSYFSMQFQIFLKLLKSTQLLTYLMFSHRMLCTFKDVYRSILYFTAAISILRSLFLESTILHRNFYQSHF